MDRQSEGEIGGDEWEQAEPSIEMEVDIVRPPARKECHEATNAEHHEECCEYEKLRSLTGAGEA